jgi:hypothetical protein
MTLRRCNSEAFAGEERLEIEGEEGAELYQRALYNSLSHEWHIEQSLRIKE